MIDVETAIRQIRAGWSLYDAGDLTIGDLYLMVSISDRLECGLRNSLPPVPESRLIYESDTPSAPYKTFCIFSRNTISKLARTLVG